jgi:hypothetical protein
MTDADTRFTLRRLPLAAKLVLTVFLLTVGLGYFSALVQLHLKHSGRNGEALPTLDDVVERFSGLRKPDDCPPQSRIEIMLSGDPDAPTVGAGNMAPAFFADSAGWPEAAGGRGREPARDPAVLRAEREGEHKALLAWVKSDPAARRKGYEDDRFPLPAELAARPITREFADNGAVKVRTLIGERCQKCHETQGQVALGSLADLEPLATPPTQELIDGKWVRSTRQITVEALTQSTHAHLLSFAVLFTLTGLVFAFTSYPGVIRGVVAPIVLLAQVLDVGCWWLARVPGYGPYFAQTIVVTGGVVGAFLGLQIVLSLLNMYGRTGKAVLVLLFLAAAAGLWALGTRVIEPALRAEREPSPATKPKDEGPRPKDAAAPPAPNGDGKPAGKAVSRLEKVIMGPVRGLPFNGKEGGSMAPAFFHKDGAGYKQEVEARGKETVDAEREGERQAVRAWIKAPPAVRKKAYEEDKFPLPADLAGKPITGDYLDETRAVRVKAILTDRCARCHAEGADEKAERYPLDTYDRLLRYIDGKK